MKKIITFSSLILCLVMIFTSCSMDMSADKFYKDYEYKDEYPLIRSGNSISNLNYLNHKSDSYEFIVFTTDSTYSETKFYNAEKDSMVLTIETKDLVLYTFKNIHSSTIIFTIEKDEQYDETVYTFNVYGNNGSKAASKEISYDPIDFSFDDFITTSSDLFTFNDRIYRVDENGGVLLLIDNPFFGKLPTDLVKTTEYYYQFADDSATVYDHSLNQVLHWTIPYDSYNDANIFLLSKEKVLVQIDDILPETEKEYDFVDSTGKKHALTSIVIDVKSGNEKKVSLDFIISEIWYTSNVVSSEQVEINIPEKIENLAEIHYIKDHKLYESDSTYASLSGSNGFVKFEIIPEFDSLPTPVAKDRYVYYSNNGNIYLLDEEFSVISKINGLVGNADKSSESYMLIDDKIYNYSLNEVYDLSVNDEKLVNLMAHSFITSREEYSEVRYTLHKADGTTQSIENYYTSNSQFYVTRDMDRWDSTYRYDFYNENGETITYINDVSGTYSTLYTADDYSFYIIAVEINGEERYYKLTK